MNLNYVTNTESKPVPFKPTRYFDYKVMDYVIVGFYKDKTTDILYGVDADRKLRKSLDGGNSWGSVLYTFNAPVSNLGGLYLNGALLVFLDNGDLVRTTDDKTFTTILTGLATPLTSAIDYDPNNLNKIMFAEYFTGTNRDLRVFYSNDTGATWNVVLTKNNPADIRHFHSVDFLPGATGMSEWIVTSGDSGAHVKWWRSVDDGATWEQIAGGFPPSVGNDQVFRALGVRLISPRTYVWVGDSYFDNYVFACSRENLTLDNKGSKGEVRRIQTLGSQGWGLSGGKHWLVAIDKVESTTNVGQYTNRIIVSGDSGGTWHSEYELTATDVLNGLAGIHGPDKFGQFYVQGHGTNMETDRRTIRMTPRKGISYLSKPINQQQILVDYRRVLHNQVTDIVATGSKWSDKLTKNVHDPLIEVRNKSNVSIVVTISTGDGMYSDLTTGASASKPIGAGQTVLIGVGDYIKSIIPKSYQIGIRSETTPSTSGNVTMILHGKAYECVDHRAL